MSERKPKLSVLDLATVGEGSSHAEALGNSVELARRSSGSAITGTGWPSTTTCRASRARRRRCSRRRSPRRPTDPRRLRRRDAAQPRAAGRRRAVRDARGAAPGADRPRDRTRARDRPDHRAALRRSADPLSDDDFPRQLVELIGFFRGEFPEGHPYNHITAVPGAGDRPAIWLLGSCGYSAQLAGMLGMPFAFAHHFTPRNTDAALELYRQHFRPSEQLAEPYAMVAVAAMCAEDDERARYLAGPGALSIPRLRAGRPTRFPTPEEAAAHEFTPAEEQSVSVLSGSAMIGGPETVRSKLDALRGAHRGGRADDHDDGPRSC